MSTEESGFPPEQMDPLFPELGQPGNPGDGESESLMAARDRITEVNEAVRAERERIRQLALAEAARGAKSGLDRLALRAFADLLGPEDPK